MKVGDLVRTNEVYAEAVGSDELGLLGIVTSLDSGDEYFPIKAKMLHDGEAWIFTEEELEVSDATDTQI